MEKTYNKLVRDNIIKIINNSNHTPYFHIAKEDEYKTLLNKKLIEEVNEFIESPSMEEMADILEVIEAITKTYNFSKEEILHVKEKKAFEKGKFDKKIVLEKVKINEEII